MKWNVTTQAFDRQTGEPLVAEPRTEIIDSEDNVLFKNCETILEVKTTYENFWNRLNNYSDLVFVQRIDKL